MKDSIHLANMLRRFTREKEEMRKRNVPTAGLPRPAAGLPRPAVGLPRPVVGLPRPAIGLPRPAIGLPRPTIGLPRPAIGLQRPAVCLPRPTAAATAAKVPNATGALLSAQSKAAGGNECNMTDLTADPTVMSLLGSANNDILQDMMGDLDFEMLDSPQPSSPMQGENGSLGMVNKVRVPQGNVMAPPPLPGGLPAPLAKRIEDLRSVRCSCVRLELQLFFIDDKFKSILQYDQESSKN